MKFKAEIRVMPHEELLDPQGRTVTNNLPTIGVENVDQVRIGKFIEMTLEAKDEQEAREKIETACQKLLANRIMERYDFSLHALT